MYLENKRQRVYRVTSDDKRERESVAPYQRERKTFCVFARSRKISRSARREADPLFCRETWPAKTRRYPSFPFPIIHSVRIRVKFWKRSFLNSWE